MLLNQQSHTISKLESLEGNNRHKGITHTCKKPDLWLKKHARQCKYMHQYATDNAVNNTPNEILRG